MRFAWYLGCALIRIAEEHDSSSQTVSTLLGIELAELENWNCRGAYSMRSVDRFASLLPSATKLALAERVGIGSLVRSLVAIVRFQDRKNSAGDTAL